jgi:hypothetical protein
MERIMRTPAEERRTMGKQARRHMLDHFSLESVLDRWHALYRQLLQERPMPLRLGKAD